MKKAHQPSGPAARTLIVAWSHFANWMTHWMLPVSVIGAGMIAFREGLIAALGPFEFPASLSAVDGGVPDWLMLSVALFICVVGSVRLGMSIRLCLTTDHSRGAIALGDRMTRAEAAFLRVYEVVVVGLVGFVGLYVALCP